MTTLPEGLPKRKALPKFLAKNYFIVKIELPNQNEEEEEGLIENEIEEDISLEVTQISEGCTILKVGDSVLMGPDQFLRPRSAFRIDNFAYYIYSEAEILGVW
jgi:hypothetical protein